MAYGIISLKNVMENEHAKLLRDFRIQRDRVLEHNTRNITIVKGEKVWIIDIPIPGDSRIPEKQLKKITQYQDLKTEFLRLWHKPIQVVPVIIGTLGAVPKELSKYLEEMGVDKVTISQLQKTTLLGSACINSRYIM